MERRREGIEHDSIVPAGERLHLLERVVVAQARGRFRPLEVDVLGAVVSPGDTIGLIEQRKEVHAAVSTFGGQIVDLLVGPGELVREGEPIAWLRVA